MRLENCRNFQSPSLAALQGVFGNPAFRLLGLPGDAVLEGVIGCISKLQLGVFEFALLGYKNYAQPITTLAFIVSSCDGAGGDYAGSGGNTRIGVGLGLGIAPQSFPAVVGFDIEMEGELARFVRVK
ncbi:hypothetical protein HDU82_008431 [Entophlyctis luteolus]|nr:hypothetical protein HDU82_008431 [Entophlyctis luteolus]